VKVINIHFTHFELHGIFEVGGWNPSFYDESRNVIIRQCSFEYTTHGITVTYGTSSPQSAAHNWHIEYCNFSHSESTAIEIYADEIREFPHVGVYDFFITNNYIYDAGFYDETNYGVILTRIKHFFFVNNTLKFVAHLGVCVCYSESKDGQIATGYSLFRGNLFDGICSANSDCGCIKIWGESESHVWKNMLVTENLCQNTFGWSKTSYNRDYWDERGYGGFGYFTDYVSGPVFYRNIAYNVGMYGFTIYKEWEDGVQTTVVNNLAVGNAIGLSLGGAEKQQITNVTVKNNVFVDSALIGLSVQNLNYPLPYDKFDINNNLYYHLGWGGAHWNSGDCAIQDSTGYKMCPTFKELHDVISAWETTEYSYDPKYGQYRSMFNLSYDTRHFVSTFEDGTFGVTSALIDKGTETLPQIVIDLLEYFGIEDVKTGERYDLGPFESGVKSYIPSSKGESGAVDPPYDWSSSGWYPSIPDSSYVPPPIPPATSSVPPATSSVPPEVRGDDAFSISSSVPLLMVFFIIFLLF